MNEIFSNRELAIIILISALFVFAIFKPTIRKSIIGLVNILCSPFILKMFLGMAIYIMNILFILHELNIWEIQNITKILFISIPIACYMTHNCNRARKKTFFKKEIMKNLKILIIVEFLINKYTFNIFIEIMLILVGLMIGSILAVKNINLSNKKVEKNLAILGTLILIFTVHSIYSDFNNFATIQTLCDFLFPILFSILFTPFVYLLELYIFYEQLFGTRIPYYIKNQKIHKYAKIKVLISFQYNLYKLDAWAKHLHAYNIKTKSELTRSINRIMNATA